MSPKRWEGAYTFDQLNADPLNPDPDEPTPIDLVMRLTRPQREERVNVLVKQARRRLRYAQTELARKGKTIEGTCLLISGGNDSMTIGHIFRDDATHIVHANTGTGIQATRDFVTRVAAEWDKPLLAGLPPEGARYENFVRGEVTTAAGESPWPPGFPGPATHQLMYDRLKGRYLAQVPHEFGISGSRTQRVLFIAGRRRAESERRKTIPAMETRGTTVWVSPLINWHKSDLRAYRLMVAEQGNPVPHNPVTDVLGMSGECGCLAYSKGGEADKWREAYPDEPFIHLIDRLEREIADRSDIPDHRKKWGWAGDWHNQAGFVEEPSFGDLCGTSCGSDDRLLEMMDPLFVMPEGGSLRRSRRA